MRCPGSGRPASPTPSAPTPTPTTAWQAYERFLQKPGPIVIGAAPGASCFGPAYEFAMILDTDLRKRKMRDRVPMTYVTSEPYIGHMGLGGVGDSKGLMESELRQHHIKWVTNAKITRVEQERLFAQELDDRGQPVREHELPFAYAMILPAFRGVDAVAAVPELCNPRGFVLIDEYQRSKKYPEIYSAGVCVAIPPVEVTPVPTGAPKTGYMIESMVTAICENIRAAIEGRAPAAKATWNAICLADFGDTGVAFVALPADSAAQRDLGQEGQVGASRQDRLREVLPAQGPERLGDAGVRDLRAEGAGRGTTEGRLRLSRKGDDHDD